MTVKYKVSDFAKDLNVSAKKVLDELAAMGSTGKKNSSTLEENELNYLLEKFSKDNSVASLDEYLNSAKQPAQPVTIVQDAAVCGAGAAGAATRTT